MLCNRGQDFRTAFEKIGGLRALTAAPFMALTASAPPEIEATIVSSLHLNRPVFVRCDLYRPNIFLSATAIKDINVRFAISITTFFISMSTLGFREI